MLKKDQHDSLTPAEKRVLIAEDAIALLRTNKFRVAAAMYYVGNTIRYTDPSMQMHEVIQNWLEEGRCYVCALGATFIATVQRFDALEVGSIPKNYDGLRNITRKPVVTYMRHFFAEDQLDMIESAFEGRPAGRYWSRDADFPNSVLWQACRVWYFILPNPAMRLLAILLNIVENHGEFVPTTDPHQYL